MHLRPCVFAVERCLLAQVRGFAEEPWRLLQSANESLQRATAGQGERPINAASTFFPVNIGEATNSCRSFLDAHAALRADGQIEWWAQQAVEAERGQLAALDRALPRSSGRIAPQLLDALVPSEPSFVEILLRRLVTTPGGLIAALDLRAALRTSVDAIGSHTSQGYALERLDRRVQALFAFWFNPGMLQLQLIDGASVTDIAGAILPVPPEGVWPDHHFFFALTHPGMSVDGQVPTPLLVGHAALSDNLPNSAGDLLVPPTKAARAACFLAIMPATAQLALSLHGLELGHTLRHLAAGHLRMKVRTTGGYGVDGAGTLEVGALAPIPGLAQTLRQTRAWEAIGEKPFAEALRRALATSIHDDEISFVDVDGDSVRFLISAERGLEVSIGEAAAPQHVSRLRVVDGGSSLRFVIEPGGQGMQVDAPKAVAERGDLIRVAQAAEALGLLPVELRDPVLQLARRHLIDSAGGRVVDSFGNFHFTGGAALRGVHWEADASRRGLATSLGIMASYAYDEASMAENAANYAGRGRVAEHQDL